MNVRLSRCGGSKCALPAVFYQNSVEEENEALHQYLIQNSQWATFNHVDRPSGCLGERHPNPSTPLSRTQLLSSHQEQQVSPGRVEEFTFP